MFCFSGFAGRGKREREREGGLGRVEGGGRGGQSRSSMIEGLGDNRTGKYLLVRKVMGNDRTGKYLW